ncbi:MAG: hypothetical protein ACI4DN_02765 [Lachnospiraceae bacterium]
MVNCILVCLLYTFVVCSQEGREKRRRIYGICLLPFINFISILLPAKIMEMIGYKIIAVLILFSFLAALFLHRKMEKELLKKNFSIGKEFMVMDRVYEEFKKKELYKWSNLFNKVCWTFTIPYIIQATPLIFTCIIGMITIALMYILFNYIKCYSFNCKINIFMITANFIVFLILGIVLYYYLEIKWVSLIVLSFSSFSKLMADKKYALFLRAELE